MSSSLLHRGNFVTPPPAPANMRTGRRPSRESMSSNPRSPNTPATSSAAVTVQSLPWGDATGAIPLRPFKRQLPCGRDDLPPGRLERPLFGIRVDNSCRTYAVIPLSESAPSGRAYRVVVSDDEGHPAATWDMPCGAIEGDESRANSVGLVDFLPDHDGGIYLLEIAETGSRELLHRLRRVGPEGRTHWTRTTPLDYAHLDPERLAGKLERLAAPASDILWLPVCSPTDAIIRLDPATGRTCGSSLGGENGVIPFISATGASYYGALPTNGPLRQSAVIRRLRDGEARSIIPVKDTFLQEILAVDAQERIFAQTSAGIARIATTGRLEWTLDIHGLVRRPQDGTLFLHIGTSASASTLHFTVERFAASGDNLGWLTLLAPDTTFDADGGSPRLVHVDANNRYYLYGGESFDRGGTLAVFSPAGELIETRSLAQPAPDDSEHPFALVDELLYPMESRAATADSYAVDHLGRLYIPVSDPSGFHVVRLTPCPDDEPLAKSEDKGTPSA